MSFIVRPARCDDVPALYDLAKLTGGGLTNLPADRGALLSKVERSEAAVARTEGGVLEELVLLILENRDTGEVRGTGQIFSFIGGSAPFYSYRIGVLTKQSRELGRSFRAETLSLANDLEGSSEVGGLFLHPAERAGGLGLLLARSRYLYIREHRERFADRLIADLRGVSDTVGGSPFWDEIAGRFFGMSFHEADTFNGIHGHQFIADLMPKHPIYTSMLSEHARAVIGVPHPGGRAAMRMLEAEGFTRSGYVDIFDGGPTLCAQTDLVATIRNARDLVVDGPMEDSNGDRLLLAAGRLAEFRCGFVSVVEHADGTSRIDRPGMDALDLQSGDRVAVVGR